MERGKWERQRPDGMHGWVMDHQSLDLSRSTSSLVTKTNSRLHPGRYPQLFWMSQLQCFYRLKMVALLNFLDRQVYVHTHAFDCEKDYNDWKHLWSGAHQRYCCSEKKPSYFWIVPRLWHYQGCYLKDIACRNKVEVIPEGVLRIGVGHKDVSKI